MNYNLTYFLEVNAFGSFPKISIDKTHFEKLNRSRKLLLEGLSIEEKYEIIIANFIDLEKTSQELSVNWMIRGYEDYSDFFDSRLKLNIKLVNLLTAVRLYTDQIPRHACKCMPEMKNCDVEIEKLFHKQYDSIFEFRFMEALRNYVQHRGMPVHGISMSSKWTDLKPKGLMKYSMHFVTKKEYLLNDEKFKRQIIDEMPDEVNLRMATKKYIESLSHIHDKVRSLIRNNLVEARNVIETTLSSYKNKCNDDFVGLHAYAYKDEERIDQFPIFLKWDDIRISLENRNRKLANLSKRYIDNKI